MEGTGERWGRVRERYMEMDRGIERDRDIER